MTIEYTSLKHYDMRPVALFFALVLASGCGIYTPLARHKDNLAYLEIGMTKLDVTSVLGKPDEVRGATVNRRGLTVTVWHYELYPDYTAAKNFGVGFCLLGIPWFVPRRADADDYYLYFVEGTLRQWGHGGDWQD